MSSEWTRSCRLTHGGRDEIEARDGEGTCARVGFLYFVAFFTCTFSGCIPPSVCIECLLGMQPILKNSEVQRSRRERKGSPGSTEETARIPFVPGCGFSMIE